ncbi:hypothetical protein [Litoribacter populi]|uniref:hypothetical protein n=1 Tax=Litoribacter populi TaxID=2598460 RepID=UPI0011807BC1|nr:hypothetical protein [Litoribacter populi]
MPKANFAQCNALFFSVNGNDMEKSVSSVPKYFSNIKTLNYEQSGENKKINVLPYDYLVFVSEVDTIMLEQKRISNRQVWLRQLTDGEERLYKRKRFNFLPKFGFVTGMTFAISAFAGFEYGIPIGVPLGIVFMNEVVNSESYFLEDDAGLRKISAREAKGYIESEVPFQPQVERLNDC